MQVLVFVIKRLLQIDQWDCGSKWCHTCANEKHTKNLFGRLNSMDGDLRVAHVTFQKERLTANHAVHQEVVFDKIQDLVWHVQRGGDALISGSICDAL